MLWQLSAVAACKWTVQPVPPTQPSDVDCRQFAIPLTPSSSYRIRSHSVYHLKTLHFALQLYALSPNTNPVLKCIVWTAYNVLRVWQNVLLTDRLLNVTVRKCIVTYRRIIICVWFYNKLWKYVNLFAVCLCVCMYVCMYVCMQVYITIQVIIFDLSFSDISNCSVSPLIQTVKSSKPSKPLHSHNNSSKHSQPLEMSFPQGHAVDLPPSWAQIDMEWGERE